MELLVNSFVLSLVFWLLPGEDNVSTSSLYLILNLFVQLNSYSSEAQGRRDAFNSLRCYRSGCITEFLES